MFARLDHVRQTERETLKFRLLALFVITVVLYYNKDTGPVWPTTGLIAGYGIYAVVLRRFLLPRYTSIPLIYGMLVADMAAALSALWLFGLDSILVAIVPILIAYYAIYLGYWATIPAATLGAFGYIGVAYGLESEISDVVSVQAPFFFILAVLAGYLAEQRLKEREEVLGLRQLIETEVKAKSLVETVKRLEQGLDLDAVAMDVARNAQKRTGFSHTALFTVDSRRRVLELRASTLPSLSMDPRSTEPADSATSGSGMGARALAAGKPVSLTPDQAPAGLASAGMSAIVACPIKHDGRDTGVLYLLNETPKELSDDYFRELEVFWEAVGRALQNALLYAEAQSHSARLLADLDRTIQDMGKFRQAQARPSRRVGPLLLDPSRERVLVNGSDIYLAKAEFDLLYALAERPTQPVNEATLLREVWGKDFVPQGNVVNVAVHRLRRKLEATELSPTAIRTVRGKGYALVVEEGQK